MGALGVRAHRRAWNARRLLAHHPDSLRYDHGARGWALADPAHRRSIEWDPDPGAIRRIASEPRSRCSRSAASASGMPSWPLGRRRRRVRSSRGSFRRCAALAVELPAGGPASFPPSSRCWRCRTSGIHGGPGDLRLARRARAGRAGGVGNHRRAQAPL